MVHEVLGTELHGWSPERVTARAYADLREGQYVNLGIGLPTQLLEAALKEPKDVLFHSENGVLGLRMPTDADDLDPDLIDAGKNLTAIVEGGAFFTHAESFAMIRGGHIDVAVLGAYEVAANGDFANWSAQLDPFDLSHERQEVPAVGGAVDLAAGARSVFVVLRSAQRNGVRRLVPSCRLPLTGKGCVDRIYCDLGVFLPAGDHFVVAEVAPGVARAEIEEMFAADPVGPVFAVQS